MTDLNTALARVSPEQWDVLMRDLNPSRIKRNPQGQSYLEAWDIKAHLTRIFGFGGFSAVADESELISAREVPQKNKPDKFNWEVVWKVRVTLSIPQLNAVYAEYAIGTNAQPSLPDAHDTAIKSAESDALKRCAINLGTQFGLSLYNNGSNRNIVQTTLVRPEGTVEAGARTAEENQAALNGHNVTDPSEQAMEAMLTLREWANVEDSTERIRGVAAIKAKYGDVMDEAVEFGGNVIVLARLADQVATGDFLEAVVPEWTLS